MFLLGLLLLCLRPLDAAPSQFNVRDYGAVGDGKSLDSEAINRTIIAATERGGGTVLFPPGSYLSASIRLRSNITLFLEAGAIIEAVDDKLAAYDMPEPNDWGDLYHYQDYGHSHWKNSLIWGIGLENVSILGPGLIYGKGLNCGFNRFADAGKGETPYKDGAPGSGNKAIALRDCRNVLLRDFSILHGGHFGILATGVDNLTVDNLKIDTNRDGMDIDACQNVRITRCSVNSPWDDGICLKASYGLGRLKHCDNITISDCYLAGNFDEGTLLDGTFKRSSPEYKSYRTGRIKLGTESNGDFKNIAITNCVFDDCRGLAIESVDGSHIEDLVISNITMRHVANSPIFIRLGSRLRGPNKPPVGTIRRVSIDNVVAYDAEGTLGCIISGIPGHPVEDIRLSNLRILQQGGGKTELGERVPPEEEDKYPEPGMFGAMPSHAFYIRHARALQFAQCKIDTLAPDRRPAFVLDDVQDIWFTGLNLTVPAGARYFDLRCVSDFSVRDSREIPDTRIQNLVTRKFIDAPPLALWEPEDGANHPLGKGRGIFPGRVTWARDVSATPWNGHTGNWWDEGTGISLPAVDRMLANSLRSLAGAASEARAWKALFKQHNLSHRGRAQAYVQGEKIAIKINCNNAYEGYGDVDGQIDQSPQVVLSLLTQLVHTAGVPEEMITVYEATRVVPDRVYKRTHDLFPKVRFVDSKGDGKNGRFPPDYVKGVLHYSVAEPMVGHDIPRCVLEATYLINLTLVKGHPTTGVSLTAKNHYGTVDVRDHSVYVNSHSHPLGTYHPFVDMIGSKELGGKTLLYILDGLYGVRDVNDLVAEHGRWTHLFKGEWLASIFLSQDPLAIDSVGLDFLRAEFPFGRFDDFQPVKNADNYLHEAALLPKAPSGIRYEQDGKALESLGVHEHWNNPLDRQYSRDLGAKEGIELLRVDVRH